MVQRLRLQLYQRADASRMAAGEGLGRHRIPADGAGRRLGVSRELVRRWLRVGWLNMRRDEDGHHIIWADADELRRLRALHRTAGAPGPTRRGWPN